LSRDLVNVVLDRVIDQADLIEKAKTGSERARELAKLAVRQAATMPDGREQFREAFLTLLLAVCATHTQEAVAIGHETLKAEIRALRALPVGALKTIPALRKADVMSRAAERRGLDGGA
jgi:hypothetical protein